MAGFGFYRCHDDDDGGEDAAEDDGSFRCHAEPASDDMAIWINGFMVYDTGLAFRIEGRNTQLRSVNASFGDSARPAQRRVMARPHSNESIQLTLAFQDGATVKSVGPNQLVPDDPTAPWLDGGGASSSRLASHAVYFLTPLPPAGPLLIEMAYPHFGIPATRQHQV